MEESDCREDEYLYLIVDGVRYEDLPELSVENCTFSQATVSRRRSSQLTGRLIVVNKEKISLFKYRGTVYAVDEICPHTGGPLHLGDIEELGEARLPCIVCPWHSWKFSLQTGHLKVPHKSNVKLRTYPVRVNEKGEVYLGVKALSPDYFNGGIDF